MKVIKSVTIKDLQVDIYFTDKLYNLIQENKDDLKNKNINDLLNGSFNDHVCLMVKDKYMKLYWYEINDVMISLKDYKKNKEQTNFSKRIGITLLTHFEVKDVHLKSKSLKDKTKYNIDCLEFTYDELIEFHKTIKFIIRSYVKS